MLPNDIVRALTGTQAEPRLTFRREFAAEPADLWAALTEPDRLARWFGTVLELPSGVGTSFRIDLGGPDDVATGSVRSCEPAERLVVTWSWEREPESAVEVLLADLGGTTQLTLTHSLRESRNAVGYGGGWEELLAALAEGFAGEPVPEGIEDRAVQRWSDMAAHAATAEVVVDAPRSRVWEAVATEAGLRSWWWSQFPDTTVAADVRPGGRCRFAVPSAGFAVEGEYLTVVPEESLSFTWSWVDDEGASADEACELRLDEVPGGIRVSVRHSGPWPDTTQSELYREGWESVFATLVASLAA